MDSRESEKNAKHYKTGKGIDTYRHTCSPKIDKNFDFVQAERVMVRLFAAEEVKEETLLLRGKFNKTKRNKKKLIARISLKKKNGAFFRPSNGSLQY